MATINRYWIALLLLVALVACTSPEPTVVPQEKPTRTPKPTFTTIPSPVPPTETPTILPTATSLPTATPVPTPTTDPYVNPLTGLRVDDPSKLDRRVLAVRIGNDAVIRPQEGLGQAEIVFEELMEGNTVTRFTALFLAADAERLRPIRSARLSSLQIVPMFDAVLVHSGASDPIRWRISQEDFTDLDQYFHAKPYGILEGYDWRGRMYTSVEDIHAYLEERGWEAEPAVKPLAFDTEAPEGPPALTIDIPYSDSSSVRWEYDESSNLYQRWVAGEPHTDALTGEQIDAANVVVLYAEHRETDIVEDSLGSTAIDIWLQGQGRAVICRDGVRLDVTWERVAEDEPLVFRDDEGDIVPFRPGQTWFQIVPTDMDVAIE
ncbi:MAG: DUF3048 domain-containing protein [Anaerolineae bacterium]